MRRKRVQRAILGILLVVSFGPGIAIVAPAFAATYSITVQTNLSSYSGTQPIIITGTVSPPPGPYTGTVVKILNPSGETVDIGSVPVNGTSGAYTFTSHPGGTSKWVAGTYTVNATWGGNGVLIFKTTSFAYSPPAASSSSSTSTTSTTSTTTSTTRAASSTSTNTTSTLTSTTRAASSTSTSTAHVSTSATSSSSSTTSSFSASFLLPYALAAAAVAVILAIWLFRRRPARPQ